MKRSVPPRRTTPLKHCGPPRAKRPTPRRVSVLRDPDYLAWLRENGVCPACKVSRLIYRDRQCASGEVIDPAHTSNNGRGSKGPDSGCLPLCRPHHAESHQIGVKDFEAKYGFDLAKLAAECYAAYLSTRRLVALPRP